MPILTDTSHSSEWVEPDEVARPVVAYGVASDEIGAFELDMHRHAKGQMLLVQRGALSIKVEGGLWIVPPRSAIWVPCNALHAIKVTGALEGYSAFIAPDVDARLPQACCTVSVTPLLRELLVRAAHLPLLYDEGGANSRMIAVLLDEIAAAKVEDLHLPMPTDARLRAMADLMMAVPSDRSTLESWAKRVGLSERTLVRLIRRETGMSFGRWRQQLGIILAVQWLADSSSIQQVAADLGYESAPSFVTMFRKTLGAPPGRYMAERHFARRL
ncbi:AraC family transcriptional regulator [Hansschlegelia plantiphila]|uniref:AraC family transcriptional regulator n=1 Tax=Hansschlegelia plantiphila TaxID=374655 RepID=UPI0022F249A5|nr:helix-turn-helix transcriptional regulator [Hansschlegelia plantiphila]